MKIKIQKGFANGCVDAPPSKSMAHRMLICAGLSEGTSKIYGIAESQDILATMDCLKTLGAKCEKNGEAVEVTGVGTLGTEIAPLACRESGSTLRFFIPIGLMAGVPVEFTGSQRLLQRPLGIYEKLCQEKDMYFSHEADKVIVKGPLKSGIYKLEGNVSSQFISGLMFALPLLDGDSKIEIAPPIESKSYIEMTIEALKTFGVEVFWGDQNNIIIPGNQSYVAKDVTVEGDYSNAAFLDALNLIGGNVKVGGLNACSTQGDQVYKELFGQLKDLKVKLNLSDCPDLGPILFAMAATSGGAHFTGTARLKIKESDRAEAMATELAKFGIEVLVLDDEVIVKPGQLKKPEMELYGHNDHRIVMSLAILSTITGGIIDGAEAVTKSFPDFFEKLSYLGIEIEKITEE